MKLTKKWVEEWKPCSGGLEWLQRQKERDGIKIVEETIKINRLNWSNWLIVRIMTYKQYVKYAVFAAEQVIDTYEKQYPDDRRPREAIEAARKCIKRATEKNKAAADSANSAANSAADSAADSAAYSAYSAYSAADLAARKKMKIKILKYGLKLLKEKKQ